MLQFLLYSYIQFVNENRKSSIKTFFELPLWIIIVTIVSFLACIVSIPILCLDHRIWSLILLLIATLGYIAILYLGDFSIAKYSARIFNEYCAYCEKVQKWLADNNYRTKEDYEELIALLSGLLEREKNEKQQKEQRADKWLQTLVIPVVLAIIVAAISKANELHNMIAITMGFLTFFFAIYIMISIIRTIIALPQKRRDVQIQNLIDDINGVITLNKE